MKPWIKYLIIFNILFSIFIGGATSAFLTNEKDRVIQKYQINEKTQDELLHYYLSKELTLKFYGWTGNLFASKSLALIFGILKETKDVIKGGEFSMRDMEADVTGTLAAEKEILSN